MLQFPFHEVRTRNVFVKTCLAARLSQRRCTGGVWGGVGVVGRGGPKLSRLIESELAFTESYRVVSRAGCALR